MLVIRRLVVPLLLFPAATDIVYDDDDSSVPVTLQCHLPGGLLDVEALEARGDLAEILVAPLQRAKAVLRLLA